MSNKLGNVGNKIFDHHPQSSIFSKSIFNLLKILFTGFIIFNLSSCKDHINKIKSITFFTTKITKEIDYKIDTKVNYSIKDLLTQKSYTSFSIFGSQKISSKPLIKDGIMYVLGNKGTVISLDINNNFKKNWSAETLDQKTNLQNSGGIELLGDKLYITNGTKDLIILNKDDGSEITRIKFANIIKSRPASSSLGAIFVITIDDNLYSIDSENFRILWKKENINEIISQSEDNRLFVYKDKLLVNYSSGRTVSYDISSRSSIDESKSWIHNLADETSIVPDFSYLNVTSEPVIYNSKGVDIVYLSNGSGIVYAIDLNFGNILSKKNFQDVQILKNYGNGFFIINNAKQFAGVSEDLRVAFVDDLTPKNENPEKFIDIFASNDSVYAVSEKSKIYQIDLQNQKLSNIIKIPLSPKFALDDEQNIYIIGETRLLVINKIKL